MENQFLLLEVPDPAFATRRNWLSCFLQAVWLRLGLLRSLDSLQ